MALGSTPDQYREALLKLSPTGVCWPTDPDSNWYKLWDAIAQQFGAVDARAVALYNEAFPDTTVELIDNWEKMVGLPDEFSDPDATLEERRAAVIFKLRARGGASAIYFEDLIAALGYQSLVVDCSPFMADIGYCGDFLFDEIWPHKFLIIVEGPVANQSLFEARIRSVQPAQAVSIFYYEDEVP